MRMTARVEVNMHTAAVKARGEGFAVEFADQLAARTAQYARANVTPGSGPGPHQHRIGSDHIDTGDLLRSIMVKHVSMGFLETAQVYTDLPYGLYLESGFHSAAGNLWRYPWLFPAAMKAQHDFANIAQSTARRWFSEEGRMFRGRVNFKAPLSGTAWPE